MEEFKDVKFGCVIGEEERKKSKGEGVREPVMA